MHFDGKQVVSRLTKYLDFEEDVDNVKLLLRWMMNEPCGDTTFDTKCIEKSPLKSDKELSILATA